jgi:branched-chain amino acid aminotransferase
LSPAFLLIAGLIKIDSPGPVFFKQERLTKHGKRFTMLKFRSMEANSEKTWTGLFNYKNDPRTTKIGRFLRSSSMDELPQLINVLAGSMSLVGPRPPVTYELGDFETLNSRYKKRFSVVAGITGLAQVKGRNISGWDRKVDFDNEYINLFHKYGILIDLKILLITIFHVFTYKNIYEEKISRDMDDEKSANAAQEEVIRLAHIPEKSEEKIKITDLCKKSELESQFTYHELEDNSAKSTVNNRFLWFDGKIVRLSDAKINVLSPTSQFGLNVFEGIRCYWNEEKKQLYAFRLEDHLIRLKRSQKLLQIEDKYTLDELRQAFIATIIANDYKEDIAVRQTIFVDGFGSWSSHSPVNMFISPIPKAKTNPEYNKKGLNCCISSWQRINDNSISPRIKCGANYINSRMAQLEALNNGYDTVIFLNQHGTVSEGPGSCLFMIREGVLITPQITDSILESITRDTIIKLARDCMNLSVVERAVNRTELYTCDEAFLCGSAMEITPILSVDSYVIGKGEAGAITTHIHKLYLEAVMGNLERYTNWVTAIY